MTGLSRQEDSMRRVISVFLIGILFVVMHVPVSSSMESQVRSGLEDLQVDPHSGSASLAYPVVVPQGRGGIQPNLSIGYNSNNRNGMLGMGWNLEIGSIVRSTQEGEPAFDDSDTIILNQNGSSQELLKDPSTGLYQTRIEGAFLKIEQTGEAWTITDRVGVKYYFGESADDREFVESDHSRIIKWCLNRVEDLHGNYMEISYVRDGNRLYPTDIVYTGNSVHGMDPFARVEFSYDDTRADVLCTYVTGTKVVTSKRLDIIRVLADVNGVETLQRRYQLTYQQSPSTNRSLLTSIQQFGMDDQTSFPATTFAYEDNADVLDPYLPVIVHDSSLTGGDNMWFTMLHVGDIYGHNGPMLVPRHNDNISVGQFLPQGHTIAWLGAYLEEVFVNHIWHWEQNTQTGRLWFQGVNDTSFKAWTNVYVDQTTEVNIPSSGAAHYMFLDQNYSAPVGNQFTLTQGFHLLEVTAYQQAGGSHYNFEIADGLANQVDYMNSVVVNVPTISGDFNGDGYNDLGTFDPQAGEINVMLSSGHAFAPAAVWLSQLANTDRLMTGDFDGDGLTDIARFDPASGSWNIGYSTASSFLYDVNPVITGFGANEDPSVGDFNGDGLADIFTFYEDAGQWKTRVALNQGGSFAPAAEYTYVAGNTSADPIAGNFNGDGLIDFGTFDKDSGVWTVRLNTGSVSDPFNQLPSITGGAGKNTIVTDFNADGLTDLGYYDPNTGDVYCMVSSGGGFMAPHPLPFQFNLDSELTRVQAQDYNGDGMADWIAYDEVGRFEIAYSQLAVPDLLVQVQNGIGARTDMTYKSSVYQNNTFLPFPVQVIASVNTSALGDTYTTSYEYADGLWDATEREFRGFGMVKVMDPELNYTKSYFQQDAVRQGRLERSETYASDHSLFAKTENVWSSSTLSSGAEFVYLERKDNFIFDGDGDGRRTAESFTYDEFGNVTEAIQWGEVNFVTGQDDIGGNYDRRIVRTYYLNSTDGDNWLLGLPRLTRIKNTFNEIQRETWFYYDNHVGNEEVPIKGLLTKKVETHYEGANPETEYTYDSFGNLKSTTDPQEHVTQITYDPTYQLFPIDTQNALLHSVKNSYYGINGEPLDDGQGYRGLWGQLKRTTDPNENQGGRSYDSLGRIEKTVSPLDTITSPTTESILECYPDYMRVVGRQRVKHGSAATIDSVSFVDGIQRAIQSKSPSHLSGQYIVSGQTEYNSRGLPIKQYLPYFSTDSMDVITPIDPAQPHAQIDYDSMGRVVRTTNPDGTYSTVEYDDWTTYSINENGHMQSSTFDAYGRLIEKREYSGADGRSPDYAPTNGSIKNHYEEYSLTRYKYDTEGNLTQTIDHAGNVTSIVYDSLGRKISMDDPNMHVWQYTYDLNGNLKSQTDALGQTIYFDYDPLNRLTRKYDNQSLNVVYDYDDPLSTESKGRLSGVDYASGDASFKYDEIGREIESIKKINGTDYRVRRTYDALNNLIDVEYPDQEKIYYDYNDAGQIKAISNDPALFDQGARHESQDDPETGLAMGESKFKWMDRLLQGIERYVFGVKPAHAADVYVNFEPTSSATPAGYLKDDGSAYDVNRGYGWSGVGLGSILAQEWSDTVDQRKNTYITRYYWEELTWQYDIPNGNYLVSLAVGNPHFSHHYHEVEVEGETVVHITTPSSAGQFYEVEDYPVTVYDGQLTMRLPVQPGGGTSLNYLIVKSAGGVSNSPPTLTTIGHQQVDEGEPLQFIVHAADPDSGDTLTYSAVNLPAGALFDPSTRQFIWTPSGGQAGDYSNIRFEVSDGMDSDFEEITITVTVPTPPPPTPSGNDIYVNFEPTSTTTPAGYLKDDGSAYTVTRGYGWSGVGMGSIVAQEWNDTSDTRKNTFITRYYWEELIWQLDIPNGEYLVSLSVGNPHFSHHYHEVEVEGINLINITTPSSAGQFYEVTDVPVSVQDGQLTMRLPAQPGGGTSINYIIISSVQSSSNTPPGMHLIGDKTVLGGDLLEFVISATDPDVGDTLTYAASNLPSGATFDQVARTFTWIPQSGQVGAYANVRFEVSDGMATDVEEITITVTAPTSPPPTGDEIYINFEPSASTTPAGYLKDDGSAYSAVRGYGWSGTGMGSMVIQEWNDMPDPRQNTYLSRSYWEELNWRYDLPNGEYLITVSAGNGHFNNQWHLVEVEGDIVINSTQPAPIRHFIEVVDHPVTVSDGKLDLRLPVQSSGSTSLNYIIIKPAGATPPPPPTQTAHLFVSNVEYNAAGQVTQMTYGNGVVTQRSYDEMFRLKRVYTMDPNGVSIQDLNYSYDSVGNIKTIVDHVNSADQTFTYDHLNRLTRAVAPESYGTKDYVYDEIGNIIQKDGRTYTYGESNAGPHAVTRVEGGGHPTMTYTYDDNGNMLSKQEHGGSLTILTYDVENRLTNVNKDGVDVSDFTYDGDGGRTNKIANNDEIKFIGSLYEEADNRSSRYIFFGETRVAQLADAQIMYYHTDHLGGTNVLTDGTGLVKRILEYKPYGEYSRNQAVNLPTDEEQAWYAFTSQYHDEESELYYYNARYYDPELGRFIQADTIVPYPANPQAFNRYTYVANNPVNLVDPSGHIFGFIAAVFSVIKAVAVTVSAYVIENLAAIAIGGAFNVGIEAVTGNISSFWDGVSSFGIGAVSSGVGLSVGAKVLNRVGRYGKFVQGLAYTVSGAAAGGFTAGFASTVKEGGNFVESIGAGTKGAVFAAVTAGTVYTAGYAVSRVADTVRHASEVKKASGTNVSTDEKAGGSIGHALDSDRAKFVSRDVATNQIEYVEESTARLYRVVSQEEFDDALLHGLRPGDGTTYQEGKFLWGASEDAMVWGHQQYGGDNFRVLEVTIKESRKQTLLYWERLDGRSDAYFANFDQLREVTILPYK